MKSIAKSECPEGLTNYLKNNDGNGTWENFCDEAQEEHKVVQNVIKNDQFGVCCYCEVDFYVSDTSHLKDFRVEHFYPKSKKRLPATNENAHLTWSNLLGACHGGTQHFYIEDERFKSKKNRHCDAVKGDKDWHQKILNPLYIPVNLKIFTFDIDGKMKVDKNCPPKLVQLAQNSIDMLNLNEKTYLINARKVIREKVHEHFKLLLDSGYTQEKALEELMEIYLSNSASNMKFYSCKLDIFI